MNHGIFTQWTVTHTKTMVHVNNMYASHRHTYKRDPKEKHIIEFHLHEIQE
jgi:hypothetical protein